MQPLYESGVTGIHRLHFNGVPAYATELGAHMYQTDVVLGFNSAKKPGGQQYGILTEYLLNTQ